MGTNLDDRIRIKQLQISVEADHDKKNNLQKQLKKMQLEKEIEQIRKKIEQLR
ncbi:hypothetical protein [Flavobacterium soyangense]|uniref:Uncharacterized protein n=1 Tax=Flavobacterium soyangense TaxID=2023265 RepID=A0A930UFP2_9FLAO|nr:hypothetical protein [Flavobacterium soyangense]MBF2710007.1 hypothetical protein [Flavobacterium soyangense]